LELIVKLLKRFYARVELARGDFKMSNDDKFFEAFFWLQSSESNPEKVLSDNLCIS
jgi:hypothetical protein